MQAPIHTVIHPDRQAYIHAYIHTHIHTYIPTYTCRVTVIHTCRVIHTSDIHPGRHTYMHTHACILKYMQAYI